MTIRTDEDRSLVTTTEIVHVPVCGGEPLVCIYKPQTTVTTNEVVAGYTQVVLNSQRGNRKDPTPFSMFKQKVSYGIGSHNETRRFADYTDSTSVYGAAVNVPSLYADDLTISEIDLYDTCVGKIYDQVRGSIDITVSVAEAGQTIKMLRDARKLEVAIRSISPKVWAKRWLSYKYGWAPLASDLYESADRIIRRNYDPFTIVRARSGRSASIPIRPDEYTSGSRSLSRRCLMQCAYDLNDPSTAVDIARWSSLSPFSFAWELMPYSFVFDWFVDVGGYIRNLESSFAFRNHFRNGFYTFTSRDSRYAAYNKTTENPSSTQHDSGYASEVVSTIGRNILIASPVSSPPRFKCDLGGSRLLSAASLLALNYKS